MKTDSSEEKKEDPPVVLHLPSLNKMSDADVVLMASPPKPTTTATNHNNHNQDTKNNTTIANNNNAGSESITFQYLSPSKRRAMAAGSAGLSELSKQLRILQAKNEAQSVEINRLERQLRILAELQGISVADLRKALEDACANEAFGELQHRVAKLRAELEAATLAKHKELRQDAAAPHIANLELRVGELEEVEEKHQAEIHHLYEQLRHEKARATRLEAEGDQYKQDAQDYMDRLNKEKARAAEIEANFQDQLQKYQLEQARKLQEMAKLAREAEELRKRREAEEAARLKAEAEVARRRKEAEEAEAAARRRKEAEEAEATRKRKEAAAAAANKGGVNAGALASTSRGLGTDPSAAGPNGQRGMANSNGIDGATGMNGNTLYSVGGNPMDTAMGTDGTGTQSRGVNATSSSSALGSVSPQMAKDYERMVQLLKEKENALREAAQKQQEYERMAKLLQEKDSALRDSARLAEDYERMVKLLKEKDDALREYEAKLQAERERLMKQMRDVENQARDAQTTLQVEKDKMALTMNELKDADSQQELRLAQFKARFAVQDERIKDMDQQLSSLYTAFGLIKEECDQEELKRAALANNLHEADEEIARHVDKVEKKRISMVRNGNGTPSNINVNSGQVLDPWTINATPNSYRGESTTPASSGVPRTITTPGSPSSSFSGGASATESGEARFRATPTAIEQPFATPRSQAYGTPEAYPSPQPPYVTPQPYVSPRSFVRPQTSPSTWQLIFPEPRLTSTKAYSTSSTGKNGLLIQGMLIVKSKSVMRAWKTKFSKLYLQGNHYQWDMEGKSYTLGFGISRVEYYPNHALAFTVYTNPFDEMAPVIHAAASTEEDYHRWMAALYKVTSGDEYQVPIQSLEQSLPHAASGSPAPMQTPASGRSSFRHSGSQSIVSGLSVEEQEAMDLSRALHLSQTLT